MRVIMKVFAILGILFFVSGCHTISNIKSTANGIETEQTGDQIYDSQNEVQLLVPWNLLV